MSAASSHDACSKSSQPVQHVVWTNDRMFSERLVNVGIAVCTDDSTSQSSDDGSEPVKASADLVIRTVEHDTKLESGPLQNNRVMPQVDQYRLHMLGQCRPCVFSSKRMQCNKGTACTFCHEFEDGRHSQRRRLGKRQRARLHRVLQSTIG
mmetsp:Transcript_98569/g.195543  ORF Transcript_98569/g.195543 Transcript_98569/m.195543 type:complete len:151 (-) Transcript_98569:31-483(-)